MISVLVTNMKGGCGKTTLATNLASAFAGAGLPTALADVDRQRSSLDWLKIRPSDAPKIGSLDWRKGKTRLPKGTARLVIDCPAGLRLKHVDELLKEANLVIVPVLPSIFDERSTERFLSKLVEIKPIRKGRKSILVVGNRTRQRSRATQRLVSFLEELDQAPIALLPDRAAYGELANQGMSVFDLQGRRGSTLRSDWVSLVAGIENAVDL